jgi:hypothetical protein
VLVVLVILAAIGVAVATYLGLERLGPRSWVPSGFRALAWSTLGILLLDLSCQRPPASLRPLVLLDASLSLGAAGGRWKEARAAAARLGEVRLLGTITGPDSAPTGGRSVVGPALEAAVASSRPVWLVTDGEVEDAPLVPGDVLARTGVKLVARQPVADLALTRVAGPERIAANDTLRIDVEVSGYGLPDRGTAQVEIGSDGVRWLSGSVPLRAGSGQATITGRLPNVSAGPHLVEVRLKDAADGEPRTDVRLLVIGVTPTPGIVVVAAPGSWESRFLFRTLSEVAALPVRGYLGLAGGHWRRMGDLAAVGGSEVDRAVEQADLLVSFGEVPDRWRTSRARGRWEWVATSKSAVPVDGEWYAAATTASPVAGAFVGLPIDSFPPGVALAALAPGPKDWVGLGVQQNRRGVERPAIIGRDSAGRREVLVGVAGLWRWAFRGGSSEQAYRALVGATASWLLGGSDPQGGRARPIRPVAEQGRPIVFERARPDTGAVRIDLKGPRGTHTDTLRFDGAGRAELALPPGRYDYRLEGGGSGLVAVETYSSELLPHPVSLTERGPTAVPARAREPLREKLWLFALAIVGFTGEWWWRRRAGLR